MIHRPTDSRLLTNLLLHEKEYTKQLSTVLEFSQASLSSFSAYAAASPPPVSQVILVVAGSIAGADEALQKYAASVDEWREQLKHLKDLEDEVGNIMRDREILVTRLIKASKQQKQTRDSFMMSPPGSPGPKGEGGSKLNSAQSELQACETHLANKTRELDLMRHSAVRIGLHERCRAMVECGWAWGEMGKEGIRALEELDAPNGHVASLPNSPPSKAFLDPNNPPSDLSSIQPSESASQTAIASPSGRMGLHSNRPYSLHIPPAHSISELVLPSHHITQSPIDGDDEHLDGDSSSVEQEIRPLELHENERFGTGRHFNIGQKGKNSKGKGKSSAENTHSYSSTEPRLPNGAPSKGKDKERKASSSMLGTLAGLFHKNTSKGRWQTRAKDASDSEGEDVKYLAVGSSQPANGDAKRSYGSRGSRLKKSKTKASTSDNTILDWSQRAAKGVSVPSQGQGEQGSSFSKDKGNGKATPRDEGLHPDPKLKKSTPPRATVARRASASSPHLPLTSAPVSLSRDSSLSKKSEMSSMSAPPAVDVIFRPGSAANAHMSPTPRKRTASAFTSPNVPRSPRGSHTRSSSLGSGAVIATPPQPNLMSIVEEAVRHNQETRNALNPDNKLESVKAPPSASVMLTREAELNLAQTKPPLPVPRSPPPLIKPIASPELSIKSEITVQKRARPSQQSKPAAANGSTPSKVVAPSPHRATVDANASFLNKPLPNRLPLKSALRNPSRTPSPPSVASKIGSPNLQPIINHPSPLIFKAQDDDAISVSSYETVHESFDSDSDGTIPPPPPPHDFPSIVNGLGDSEISHSTSSTATGELGTRRRRKSVRMSLPPTYSVTPPAVDDWEGDKKYPWASRTVDTGWSSRRNDSAEKDIWEDSSEEDEEYTRARKLLYKVSGRRKH